MKKIILGTFLMMITGLIFVGRSEAKPIVVTTYQPGSFSAGVFGCWGSSVCRVDVVYDDGKPTRAKVRTLVTNNENGTLTIRFDTTIFNTKNKEYYKKRNVFEIEKEFQLNAAECQGLELPANSAILPGKYKIKRSEEYLIVEVKLKR